MWSEKSNKFLKPHKGKTGYLTVELGSKGTPFRIHRLVASLYVDNPEGLKEVNHKDGDKANNCANNLEWVTRAYNCQHKYAKGLHSYVGTNHTQAKLSEQDVQKICELLGALRVVDVHKRYPQVSRGTISNIKKGYAWCHVSYKFGIVPKRWPEHLSFPIGVDTTNWVRYRKHD